MKGEANTTNAERVDTMTKMTYVAALSTAIAVLSADPAQAEVVEKLTALKEQTEKRNSADRKPTKAQLANEALKAKVAEVLPTLPGKMTVTEVMAADAELADLSNQKVAALLRGLVTDGKAIRTEDKRKAYFSRA